MSPQEAQRFMQGLLAKLRTVPGSIGEKSQALIPDITALDLVDARLVAIMSLAMLAVAGDQVEDLKAQMFALRDELQDAGVI